MPKLRCSKSPVNWEELRRSLMPYAYRQTGNNWQDAEDVVQEALTNYWLRIEDGKEIANPWAYLQRSVHNLIINHWRRYHRSYRVHHRLVPLPREVEGPGINDEALDARIILERMDKEKVQWLLEYEKGRNHPTRDRVRALRYRAALRCAT